MNGKCTVLLGHYEYFILFLYWLIHCLNLPLIGGRFQMVKRKLLVPHIFKHMCPYMLIPMPLESLSCWLTKYPGILEFTSVAHGAQLPIYIGLWIGSEVGEEELEAKAAVPCDLNGHVCLVAPMLIGQDAPVIVASSCRLEWDGITRCFCFPVGCVLIHPQKSPFGRCSLNRVCRWQDKMQLLLKFPKETSPGKQSWKGSLAFYKRLGAWCFLDLGLLQNRCLA